MDAPKLTDLDVKSLIVEHHIKHNFNFQIQRVYEGGENQTWFIDGDLVLRVNVDEGGDKRQSRELAVREIVRQYCADPNIIPRCIASGVWGDHNLPFVVESRIHGVSLEKISANQTTEADLALLLLALKAVPLDSLNMFGLETEEEVDFNELKSEALEAWQRLFDNNQLSLEEGVGTILMLPDLTIFVGVQHLPPVLLHADIKGEHILVDKLARSVVGLIDWTDVMIGNAATDVAGLAISVGSRSAGRIASLAGYADCVVARAIFQARCESVLWLDDRLNGDDESPIDLLTVQLNRALESTHLG